MADDDLTLLTTPIAKGKSLLKKLRREMSTSKASGRPYLSPADTHAPYTMAVDEPLASGTRDETRGFGANLQPAGNSRRGRRIVRRSPRDDDDDVELSELRRPIRRSATPEGGQPMYGMRSQYGEVLAETRHNPSVTVNTSSSGSFQAGGLIQTGAAAGIRGSRSVRWSDADSIRKDRCLDRCSAHGVQPSSTASEAEPGSSRGPTAADASRKHQQQQQPDNDTDNPWTIYRDPDTYFLYGTSLRARNPPKPRPGCCDWWHEMWAPYGGFRQMTSAWIFASLSLLLVANVIFMTAFVTNYWGIVHVTHDPASSALSRSPEQRGVTPSADSSLSDNGTSYLDRIWSSWSAIPRAFHFVASAFGDQERQRRDVSPAAGSGQEDKHVLNRMANRNVTKEYWTFGLWQCCRNTDGLCLGPRFEAFYMATRTLCVLSLFLMILSFAWMMGHTLEKLLDYDICTMSCLISMCYITAIFTTIAVVCFGVRWPKDFGNEYDGTYAELAYSFYLAVMTIPLTLAAAICSTMDLKTGLDQFRKDEKFYSDLDNFADRTMSSIPRDNISRPKRQKKKRAEHSQSPYLLASSEA